MLPKLEPAGPKQHSDSKKPGDPSGPAQCSTGNREQSVPSTFIDPKVLRQQQKEAKVVDIQRRHDAFVADELEVWYGTFMPTKEPWEMWKHRCAMRGEDPGIQREFTQRLAKNFMHDHNNGRPRFLNVRAKASKPSLRVVS